MGELGVKVGQTVVDADGKRLGKVSRCDPWAFEVRRGLFTGRTWVVRYDEIAELGDDSIRIARSDADLFELAAGELPHSWETIDASEGEGRIAAAPGERGSATLGPSADGGRGTEEAVRHR